MSFPALEAQGLTGVLRRGVVGAIDGAGGYRPPSLAHRLGGGGPVLQEPDELCTVLRDDVEGCNVKAVLGRRGDAGLAVAVKGTMSPGAAVRGRRGDSVSLPKQARRQAGHGARAAEPRQGQQPPAGQAECPGVASADGGAPAETWLPPKGQPVTGLRPK